MSQNLFSWNGVTYDLIIPENGIEEAFEKLSGDKSGRTQDGNMFIDPIGTFYNYTITVRRAPTCSLHDYDAFFTAISSPQSFGMLQVPHGQGSLIFSAYITNGTRKLLKQINGQNYWGEITLQFVAKAPQRTV